MLLYTPSPTHEDRAHETMTTCESSAPVSRGEAPAAGSDDPGPSRSRTDSSGESSEPPNTAGAVVVELIAEETRAVDFENLSELSMRLVAEASRGLCDGGAVRVRLLADEAMSDAHARYCGVCGTTDVITFDLAEGRSAAGEPLDVDLLVCVDEAYRQAETRHHTVETELALYVLHGVLHALGYDDLDEESYERMHAREDEVFRALGLGAAIGRGEQA